MVQAGKRAAVIIKRNAGVHIHPCSLDMSFAIEGGTRGPSTVSDHFGPILGAGR